MKPRGIYGQFCPVALAAEVLAERWTPLVVRELLGGARRFADIHRGVPQMSPTMLSRRLRELEQAEVLVRRLTRGRKIEYHLTEAGRALFPIIMDFAVWGQRFARMRIRPGEVDPGLLMWELRRWMDLSAMPAGRSVVLFRFPDADKKHQCWWLVAEGGEVELCVQHPGFGTDLVVDADTATLARLWRGDLSTAQALTSGKLRLSGSPKLAGSFERWIGLSSLTRPRKTGPLPPPRRIAAGSSRKSQGPKTDAKF